MAGLHHGRPRSFLAPRRQGALLRLAGGRHDRRVRRGAPGRIARSGTAPRPLRRRRGGRQSNRSQLRRLGGRPAFPRQAPGPGPGASGEHRLHELAHGHHKAMSSPTIDSRRSLTAADLAGSPNPLAPHYSRFRVAERMLLSGHSHQAWPDVGFEGQVEAWNDAATYVDEKWSRAEVKAERVRRGYAKLLGDRDGTIGLAPNTHDLLVKLLSALPLQKRPKLVTTDGEFHTSRRQLDRLSEEKWIEVVKVSASPPDAIAERLAAATDERTALVLASSILYKNAHVVPNLRAVMERCRTVGAELVVDAYHQLNVRPFSLGRDGFEDAFVTGGGYKYCQLGEGNAYLRVPPGRDHLRPVITGWFSEFARLTKQVQPGVAYGEGGAKWA